MGFGNVTKYLEIDPKNDFNVQGSTVKKVDKAIDEASEVYEGMVHNLFCNNCHHHVARALNRLNYLDSNSWGTFSLMILLMRKGKFVSWKRFLSTYLGFFLFLIASIFAIVIMNH